MPPDTQDRHPELRERTKMLLEGARLFFAHTENGYSSRRTRETMNSAFKAKMDSDAHPWQLDVAEALLLKLDCIVIAGTGSGKTIPFMLPFLLPQNKGKMALIISPLLSLQAEQAARFNRVGIPAVAVNHHTLNKELLARLDNNEFQVILAGPEMVLDNEAFSAWFKRKRTLESFLFVAIDEAHLVKLWGAEFRPYYHLLTDLRSLLPTNIPILATSATITPDTEREICKVLEIDFHKAYYLNLGNDRPNIAHHVHLMQSSTDYSALLPFLPDPSTPPRYWPKMQIFVNTVMESQIVCDYIAARYPDDAKRRIDYIHSTRTPSARRRRIRRFRRGTIKILVSTEIGAMGQDIPDIVEVLQFGATESLEAYHQRIGRGGREFDIFAVGRLLIERSCFQAVKKSVRKKAKKSGAAAVDATRGEGGSAAQPAPATGEPLPFPVLLANDALPGHLQWRKVLDPGLRLYASAQRCRRDVADEYFANPKRTTPPTDRCCDVCDGDGPFPLPPLPTNNNPQPERPQTPENAPGSAASSPASTPNKNRKRGRANGDGADVGAAGPKVRAKDHLVDAKAALRGLCSKIMRRDYPGGPFTSDMLMSDEALRTLAYNRYTTLDEMASGLKNRPWGFMDEYGQEVLDILGRLDRDELERREAERLEKEQEKEQREKEKRADSARKAAEKQAEIAERQRRVLEQRQIAAANRAAEQAANAAHLATERARKAAQKAHEKQAKLIAEYVEWLNREKKSGRAKNCPPGIELYLEQNPEVMNEFGRKYYLQRIKPPLLPRDINVALHHPTLSIPNYLP
ncbi:Bloom syndrome [Mycena kentingensis (nom. inval.)]|nr:Bloom syndrome [Mycena kentingensis (nom. inval.)]